ncbi:MAG: glycogen/starch synthase [Patescibacteria group bacterium]
MPKTKLKIASVSAEVDPYSKTGGLADVARSLPRAFKKIGHNVIIITPFYTKLIDPKKHNLKKIFEKITIIIDNKNKAYVNFWQGEMFPGIPIYFIENEKYFSKKTKPYGSEHENARFLLFDLATLKLITKLKFKADIIHCHDWHTGLIPYFLKRDFKNSETLKKTASVFTIHNLTFQLGKNWWEIPENKRDHSNNDLPSFNDPDIEYINFAKRAILNANVINTVSEQYAKEIMTKDFGEDLHRILKNRENIIFGIINGIDQIDYNPANDPGLVSNYDQHNIMAKQKNKTYIQKMFNLPIKKDVPMISMIGRVTEQKGFDLLREISDTIFRFNLQLIIIGDGDKNYMNNLKDLAKKYPNKFYASFKFINSEDTTKIFAGSDMILMPSRFEPCGMPQMFAMRYGTIPIVHHVGGLIDTVSNYNPRNQTGNGFSFELYDPRSMVIAISRAIETYKRENEWKKLVKKVMTQSFSWEYPARKYIKLYKTALRNKHKKT